LKVNKNIIGGHIMVVELTEEIREFLSDLLEDEPAKKLVILIESGKNYDEILDILINELNSTKGQEVYE